MFFFFFFSLTEVLACLAWADIWATFWGSRVLTASLSQALLHHLCPQSLPWAYVCHWSSPCPACPHTPRIILSQNSDSFSRPCAFLPLSFILPQSISFISLFSIHTGLLSVLRTCEALCYLEVFALAVPWAWSVLLQSWLRNIRSSVPMTLPYRSFPYPNSPPFYSVYSQHLSSAFILSFSLVFLPY